jgi:hypothetical protein
MASQMIRRDWSYIFASYRKDTVVVTTFPCQNFDLDIRTKTVKVHDNYM